MARTREERREALEEALERLREAAEHGTVVVEGQRDEAALRALAVGGQHYRLNRGHALALVVEELAQAAPPVILLLDWDRTGGRLVRTLEENLRARVQVDTDCRRRLAAAAHARCVEELPSELASLVDEARRPSSSPRP